MRAQQCVLVFFLGGLVACGGKTSADWNGWQQEERSGGSGTEVSAGSGPSVGGEGSAVNIGGRGDLAQGGAEAHEPVGETGANGSVGGHSGGAPGAGAGASLPDGGTGGTGSHGSGGGDSASGGTGAPVLAGGTTGASGGGGSIAVGGSGAAADVVVGRANGIGGNVARDPPVDCAPRDRSSRDDYCSVEFTCASGSLYTWCDMWSPGPATCGCETMGRVLYYELEAPADSGACDVVASLCVAHSTDPVQFTESAVCVPRREELDSDHCDLEAECSQRQEVANGVLAVSGDTRRAWCDYGDDVAACTCGADQDGVTLSLPAPIAEVCHAAMDICYAGAGDFDAQWDCSLTDEATSDEWCAARHECTRAGRVEDTSFQAFGALVTGCYVESADLWTCDCGIGATAETFRVGAVTAWTACEVASAACASGLTPSDPDT